MFSRGNRQHLTGPLRNGDAPWELAYLPAVPWTPDLIGPVAWFDVDDAATITEAGGFVSQVDDKSGNGNHLTQPSGANQPVLGLTSMGMDCLQFNASSYWMMADGVAQMIANGDYTIAMQLRAPWIFPLASYDYIWNLKDAAFSFATQGYANVIDDLSKKQIQWAMSDETPSFASASMPSVTPSEYLVDVWSKEAAAIEGHLSHKGTVLTPRNHEGVQTTFDNFTIGAARSGAASASQHSNFWLCEMLVFDRVLTETERQQVEGYLSHKWGYESVLPISHPYKSSAPEFIQAELNPCSPTDNQREQDAIWFESNKGRELLIKESPSTAGFFEVSGGEIIPLDLTP